MSFPYFCIMEIKTTNPMCLKAYTQNICSLIIRSLMEKKNHWICCLLIPKELLLYSKMRYWVGKKHTHLNSSGMQWCGSPGYNRWSTSIVQAVPKLQMGYSPKVDSNVCCLEVSKAFCHGNKVIRDSWISKLAHKSWSRP